MKWFDTGAYYNSHALTGKGGPSTGSIPKRGVRGPMDHFMVNLDQEDGGEDAGTQMNAKEARNRCALDVGRFLIENSIPFHVASSPSFVIMCRSLGNYGRGFKPPTPYELSTL